MKDDDKSTQPAKLQDHLYAVHATDFRPSQDNHVQLARSSIATNNPMEEEVLKKLGNLRFTLHWSLGSVVPLEGLKDCEDKAVDAGKRQFAIVTLVKNLIPQLVNIYWNDTFILGNYALSDQDHVLIPEQLIEQNDTESWGNAKLHGYDPETEDLRQAVNRLLESFEGEDPCMYKVHSKVQTVTDELQNEFTISCQGEDQDISGSNSHFFNDILQNDLSISFGLHGRHICGGLQGEYLWLQEQVIIGYLFTIWLPLVDEPQLSPEDLKLLKMANDVAKEKLIEWVESKDSLIKVKEEFISFQNNITDLCKIIDLELFLIEKYKMTLVGADKDHIYYLLENRNESIEKLKEYLENLIATRQDVFKKYVPVVPKEYLNNLIATRPDLFKKYDPVVSDVGLNESHDSPRPKL